MIQQVGEELPPVKRHIARYDFPTSSVHVMGQHYYQSAHVTGWLMPMIP